ncbi:uncharacterized protein BDV14DRAFT_195328 [Aspergillus stella-maris]|uniref:uncharacterized protein n=1 Tax=Aspergillus stella-maris TaxID=1810926 RepID=UPI003CCCF84D
MRCGTFFLIKTLETLRTANSDSNTTPAPAIPEPPFALLDAFEAEESTSVVEHDPLNNPTLQEPSIEISLDTSPTAQNTDEQDLLHDYQCMLDEDLEDPASPRRVEVSGAVSQSPRHLHGHSLEMPGHFESVENDRPLAATHLAPLSTDATAVTVTSTNQFISSLPSDLMDSAFLESSLEFLHHFDPTFLGADIQPGALEQMNLANVDLDGMDFWTSHLLPA